MINYGNLYIAPDDPRFTVVRMDISGGQNTRYHPQRIGEGQCELVQNVDIGTIGKRIKRKGSMQESDDMGASTVIYLHDYNRQGYTDQLMAIEDNNLNAMQVISNASLGYILDSHAEVKGDYTSSLTDWGIINAKMAVSHASYAYTIPDDVIIVQNGTDNPYAFHKNSLDSWAEWDLGTTSGTGSDSPPLSTVMAWYNNRIWVLKNDKLYYSAPYSDDYSTAFDTVADWFRVPVGEERGIATTRDTGMVVMGEQEIWGLSPSATPAATDQPQPLVTDHGVVSKRGWLKAKDDIYYFSKDGFRALRRTIQDKLQVGTSYPLSYVLKEEFDVVDWEYIDRLCMVDYDNKIFMTVPTGSNTFKTWIYYPSSGGWSVLTGWSPRSYATHKIKGEERMYYGDSGDGKVYRGWYGHTDEGTTTTDGTAIEYDEYGREEDFGQPLLDKVGGEIEVESEAGQFDGDFSVYVGKDGDSPIYVGRIATYGESNPTLPLDLPFNLTGKSAVRKKFNLDGLGTYRTLQYRLYNNQANDEEIVVKSVSFITFPEEYQSNER